MKLLRKLYSDRRVSFFSTAPNQAPESASLSRAFREARIFVANCMKCVVQGGVTTLALPLNFACLSMDKFIASFKAVLADVIIEIKVNNTLTMKICTLHTTQRPLWQRAGVSFAGLYLDCWAIDMCGQVRAALTPREGCAHKLEHGLTLPLALRFCSLQKRPCGDPLQLQPAGKSVPDLSCNTLTLHDWWHSVKLALVVINSACPLCGIRQISTSQCFNVNETDDCHKMSRSPIESISTWALIPVRQTRRRALGHFHLQDLQWQTGINLCHKSSQNDFFLWQKGICTF